VVPLNYIFLKFDEVKLFIFLKTLNKHEYMRSSRSGKKERGGAWFDSERLFFFCLFFFREKSQMIKEAAIPINNKYEKLLIELLGPFPTLIFFK